MIQYEIADMVLELITKSENRNRSFSVRQLQKEIDIKIPLRDYKTVISMLHNDTSNYPEKPFVLVHNGKISASEFTKEYLSIGDFISIRSHILQLRNEKLLSDLRENKFLNEIYSEIDSASISKKSNFYSWRILIAILILALLFSVYIFLK